MSVECSDLSECEPVMHFANLSVLEKAVNLSISQVERSS